MKNAKNITLTWEVAKANAGVADQRQNGGPALDEATQNGSGGNFGPVYGKLKRNLGLARKYQKSINKSK